ncbi:MAG: DUF805 domain-containing protein [Flavobacteriales bacterium]|nr:DUF805 domain-containing protein [Flavobacteriales bacterium]
MNPINYYLKVWQNYATFSGRARRSEYWYFFLFNIIVSFLVGIIAVMTGLMILPNLYSLAVLIPGIAVAVRRMHDVGKSGWFVLVPIYNLFLALSEGDEGDNPYGPDPKNEFY